MNIAVCIKQTPDTEGAVYPSADGHSVAPFDGTWIMSPHDEAAVECALQLKDSVGAAVTVIALGPEHVEKALREALAMGADAAIHIRCDAMPTDSAVSACALAEELAKHSFQLILTGEVAIDTQGAQVPQRIGVRLGMPCVGAVEAATIGEHQCLVERMIEGEREHIQCTLPAVLAINRRFAEPRYPTFRGIMQAKRKPITVVESRLADAGMTVRHVYAPAAKEKGHVVQYGAGTAGDVVRYLREDAKVI